MKTSISRVELRRLATGVAGLDTILGGGLFEGGLYVVHGLPGTGKTVLANQIAFHRAREGGRVTYLTLMAEAHDRMLLHLDRLSFTDRALLPDPLSYASVYAIVEEEGLAGLVRLVRETVRQQRPSILVLDGLYVAQERSGSEIGFRQFLYELQGEAALKGVLFLLLASGAPTVNSAMQTMVDGVIELRDELAGEQARRTLQITKLRGSGHLRGRHTFKITRDGVLIFPRLETLVTTNVGAGPSENRMTTQVGGLDAMLQGGLPAASTTLLAGPSGSGKTTFGLAFVAGATPDERAVFFGCFETEAAVRLKARAVGLPVERLLASGVLSIVWQRPFESSLDEMAHRLFEAVTATGAKRLFIDGLGAFRRALPEPGRLSSFFAALTIRLRCQGVTTVCSTETGSLVPSQELQLDDISLIAENTLLLGLSRPDTHLARTLSIMKVRQSGFDTATVLLEISDQGLITRGGTAPGRTGSAAPRPDRH